MVLLKNIIGEKMSQKKYEKNKDNESKQKSIVLIVVLAMAAIILMTFVFGKAFNNSNSGSPVGSSTVVPSASSNVAVTQSADIRDGKQYITLSMSSGSRYVLTPSALVAGVPVVMTVDLNTVNGCMRGVVIPAFNVNKYVSTGDNVIEFTPTKAGTYGIQCSMNMGRGAFTVVASSAAVASTPTPVVAASAGGSCGGSANPSGSPANSGGSCGGSGGGCGCGSR